MCLFSFSFFLSLYSKFCFLAFFFISLFIFILRTHLFIFFICFHLFFLPFFFYLPLFFFNSCLFISLVMHDHGFPLFTMHQAPPPPSSPSFSIPSFLHPHSAHRHCARSFPLVALHSFPPPYIRATLHPLALLPAISVPLSLSLSSHLLTFLFSICLHLSSSIPISSQLCPLMHSPAPNISLLLCHVTAFLSISESIPQFSTKPFSFRSIFPSLYNPLIIVVISIFSSVTLFPMFSFFSYFR